MFGIEVYWSGFRRRFIKLRITDEGLLPETALYVRYYLSLKVLTTFNDFCYTCILSIQNTLSFHVYDSEFTNSLCGQLV